MIHLHNGILHSRKKEGAPTLHDSMDGSEKHYGKLYVLHFNNTGIKNKWKVTRGEGGVIMGGITRTDV